GARRSGGAWGRGAEASEGTIGSSQRQGRGGLPAGVGPAPAAAGGASPAPAPTEGTLRTRDGKEIVDVPLKHTRADIRVHGVVADVEVEQTFQNPYRQKIEASYLFPLPTRSAVFGYEIRVGGRTIVGELRPRDEAVQKYK